MTVKKLLETIERVEAEICGKPNGEIFERCTGLDSVGMFLLLDTTAHSLGIEFNARTCDGLGKLAIIVAKIAHDHLINEALKGATTDGSNSAV